MWRKTLKIFFKFLRTAVIFVLSLAVYGCAGLLNSSEKDDGMKKNQNGYGSIQVIQEKDRSALDVSSIKYAKIVVSGSGIALEEEPCSGFVEVKDGKASGITVENIPSGKNRIVTVTGYDSGKNEIPLAKIRAVCTIENGKKTDVTVSKQTTAYGNVLYGIKETFDLEEIDDGNRLESIKKVINSEVNPLLYDSDKLIAELKGFSFPYAATKDDYTLHTGSVSFNYIIADNFSVSVDDPLSENISGQKADYGIKVEGILPGNWNLKISDAEGNLLEKTEVQVKSGEETDLGFIEHDGIVILMRKGKKDSGSKEYDKIHYWDLSYGSDYSGEKLSSTTWPGVSFSASVSVQKPVDESTGTEDSDHKNFYVQDFKGASAVSVLVTTSSGSKYCSSNMVCEQKGIYCVHSSGLKPVVVFGEGGGDEPVEDLNPTDEELTKCFRDDPENKKFYVFLSDSKYTANGGSVITSCKAEFNSGINDHEGKYQGPHYTMNHDSKGGFWYCSVPYADVQATNQSGQPSYNFKINENVRYAKSGNGVSPDKGLGFIPDGYIYQKFNSSSAEKNFLVLIYSWQDEEIITRNLSAAKKAKTLKDFDLTTEKGKQEISNFRLLAGTSGIYRSYHPYSDDKTGISDTSRKRMECLSELASKAGIKADINLANTSQTSATYGMPSYYQDIINKGNVLYMTDCSYTVCYTESDSPAFAKGVAKIVDFINTHEGPYQFHCAIGTDRTGVVGSVLSAMCGASWASIQEDYCKSIEMGIYEYRGPGCVRYSMQKMLGVSNIDEVEDLQKAVKDYFVNGKYLTADQIETMVSRVK